MKKIRILLFFVFFLVGMRYMIYPTPPFPSPPPDAYISYEPADIETPLRRGYYTDYTREQVILHYLEQFKWLPTLRLNYPPEEAQTIIRDQTRSSYLEELVHPMRESWFINGFVPTSQNEEIWREGKKYEQKIIIRYVSSSLSARIFVFILTTAALWLVLKRFELVIGEITEIPWKKIIKKFYK